MKILILASLAVVCASQAPLAFPSSDQVSNFIGQDISKFETDPRGLFLSIAKALKDEGNSLLKCNWLTSTFDSFLSTFGFDLKSLVCSEPFLSEKRNLRNFEDVANNSEYSEFPYFGFIPIVEGKAIPGGSEIEWSAKCFTSMKAKVVSLPNGKIDIVFTASNPSSLFCADDYILYTVNGLWFAHIGTKGEHHVSWTIPDSTNDKEGHYDLIAKGIRIARFLRPIHTLIGNLVQTVLLFEPEITKHIPQPISKINQDFLQKYSGLVLKDRTKGIVSLSEDQIKSGDAFGIIRMDGLDPMLAWAMGSTTGHMTIALRDPASGELYVCESTTKDSYWPTDGIQKNKYNDWIALAIDAGYSVVHLPLHETYSKKFNNTAAWNFMLENEGFSYGFYNILNAWIDTVQNNYPCVPPHYEACLTWDLFELVFSTIDKISPKISDLIITQSMNKRIGTSGLNMKELLYAANGKFVPQDIMPIPEKDGWLYNTTRYGKPAVGLSMVCDVFVCHNWKVAGLFAEVNDELNCGEFTNWDAYSLNIFADPSDRPQICKDTDPDNQNCQLMGPFEVQLNNYNSRKIHKDMGDYCGGTNPTYVRGDAC